MVNEKGIHKDGPYTGTGQPKPEERSLPAKVTVVFRDKDGKRIGK